MIVTVLTWTGMGISILALALLIVPIRIFAAGSVDDRKGIDYQLIVDWAFGIFSFRATSVRPASLYFAGLRLCHIPMKIDKKKKIQKKPGKEKPSSYTWLGWLRGNFPLINHVLKNFVRAAFLKGYLVGKIGLTDPADASFIGILGRLLRIRTQRFNLSLTTVYEYEIMHIRAQIQSTLIIGYLGLVALRLLLDKQIRVMVRGLPQTK